MALPLTLSACGLLGGGAEDQNPVVIPSEAPADPAASDASPSGPTDATSPTESAAAAPTPSGPASAPVVNTVTKTGVVISNRTRTQTQTQTRTATATKTLPQVTVTLPPITVTETRTETRTQIVQGPGTTVTRTVICSGTPPVCA